MWLGISSVLFGISLRRGHGPTGSFQSNSSLATASGKGVEDEAGRHGPSTRLSVYLLGNSEYGDKPRRVTPSLQSGVLRDPNTLTVSQPTSLSEHEYLGLGGGLKMKRPSSTGLYEVMRMQCSQTSENGPGMLSIDPSAGALRTWQRQSIFGARLPPPTPQILGKWENMRPDTHTNTNTP